MRACSVHGQPKAESKAWILPFALLVMAIVVVPLQILDEKGLPRYRQLGDELLELERENARLEAEARHLAAEVRRLRDDPQALEQVARDELGMVREGEIIFQFPAE